MTAKWILSQSAMEYSPKYIISWAIKQAINWRKLKSYRVYCLTKVKLEINNKKDNNKISKLLERKHIWKICVVKTKVSKIILKKRTSTNEYQHKLFEWNNMKREAYSINTYIRSEGSWIKKSKFQAQETIRENKPYISRMK